MRVWQRTKKQAKKNVTSMIGEFESIKITVSSLSGVAVLTEPLT